MFEDSFFHLVETKVVFIEDGLGRCDVDGVFAVGLPWQGGDPVEVAAHDGGLGGHHRHHAKLFEFTGDALFGLGGQVLLREAPFEVIELVFEFVLQVIAAARSRGGRGGSGLVALLVRALVETTTHLALHAHDFAFGVDELDEPLHAQLDAHLLQQGLFVLGTNGHVPRDDVGATTWMQDLRDVLWNFWLQSFGQARELLEGGHQARHEVGDDFG